MSAALITQRRTQLVVHSYLYYVLDQPIVSDDKWQDWADQLVQLQRDYPGPVDDLDPDFADWTGDTGVHLPRGGAVHAHAMHLLKLHENPELRGDSFEQRMARREAESKRLYDGYQAAAREKGRQAFLAGQERRPHSYRKRIEVDAWLEGYDEAAAAAAAHATEPVPEPEPVDVQAAGQLAIGRIVHTNYNTGPYIIRQITGPCTCPEYVASLGKDAPRSEPHYHLTVHEAEPPKGKRDITSWLNGYRPDGANVWSKDRLIFGDLAPGTQQDLFGF